MQSAITPATHVIGFVGIGAMGTPMELLHRFGGKKAEFERAVHDLQAALYAEAA